MSETQLSGLLAKLDDLDTEDPSPIVDDSDRIRWYVRRRLGKLRYQEQRKFDKSLAYVREAAKAREDRDTGAL